nr:hypothetical protein [Prevotella sp.]
MLHLNNLTMADAVANDTRISVKKSFFGLKENVIFLPTKSMVNVFRKEYTAEVGKNIENLLDKNADELLSSDNTNSFSPVNTGNYMVEGCMATDHQYVALRVYRFESLRFNPLMDTKFYVGKVAEKIATLF